MTENENIKQKALAQDKFGLACSDDALLSLIENKNCLI